LIEEISIRDLGVISDAKLKFGPGLNVLTGETGAGKTMVLTALGLLLGDRSDVGAIRQGSEQATVQGTWRLPEGNAVAQLVVEAGGFVEENTLFVNRTVSRDGRARAAVGSVNAPISLLSMIGSKLVVVHGQADQIRLKSPTAQREALDNFAGLKLLLGEYATAYEAWKEASRRLKTLQENLSRADQEHSDLTAASEEIAKVNPLKGEDAELGEKIERLTHSEELRLAVSNAHEFISNQSYEEVEDAIGLLGKARKQLELVSQLDPKLQEQVEALKDLGMQLGEVSTFLGAYLSGMEEGGPADLELLQSRRADLSSLIRKYGPTLDDVLKYQESLGARLLEIDTSDEMLNRLQTEVEDCHQRALVLAANLTEKRLEAAATLATEVTGELANLAMGGANLRVLVEPTEELGPFGKDSVSILLSAYPGAEPRALGKGASGGELSRIMLALEVVLAKNEQALTFIFDEVDAGVGGAAAIEVAKRLARLSRSAQVIVVTHLGQVAAYANEHLRVLKTVGQSFTGSDVVNLDLEARVEEIARMISGLSESDSARGNARELLSQAQAFASQQL